MFQLQRNFIAVAICLLLTACNSKPSDGRDLWKHSAGEFRWSSGRDWNEQAQDGPHRYREVARTAELVELQDKDRPIKVFLYADRSEAEMNGAIRVALYQGGWEKPAAAPSK